MLTEVERTPPSPDGPELSTQEAQASARAVVNLFAKWGLSDEEARQVLGGLPARTWARWKTGAIGRIDRDLATRLSLLLGIHKATRYLFNRDLQRAYGWIRARNTVFGGQSALDVLLGGQIIDLYSVRRYLDAERSGW
ncbi:MbcA/ParS/Xre antitoxin family protein [Roseivivax sp. CAU 1753]